MSDQLNFSVHMPVLASGLVSILAVPVSVSAAGPVSVRSELGVVSDYRFRGISLSDEQPAVQGGLTASLATGLYGGLWASTIDETGPGEDGKGATVELDYTLGWAFQHGGYDIDVAASAYTYPGGHAVNYFELPVSVSRSMEAWTWTLGGAYAPARQKALSRRDNIYGYGEVKWSAKQPDLSLVLRTGYEHGAFAPHGKWDWAATLGHDFGPVAGALTFVTSDDHASSDTLVASLVASF